MKKDLRSMAQNAARTDPNPSADPKKVGSILEQAKRYEGKSESELMDELMKRAGEQKAAGSFSPELLDQFAQRAGAMMNDEQKKKLRQIVRRLKSN